jgi:hypothetical protein
MAIFGQELGYRLQVIVFLFCPLYSPRPLGEGLGGV